MDDPEYTVDPGSDIPWRDLTREESRRPPRLDVEITDVAATAVAGNFPWGLVRVETDAGYTGIGETHPIRESVDAAERMAVHLQGENPLDVARIVELLDQRYTGSGSIAQAAIAGIEIACWDVKGKVLDVPVYELLGGLFRESVPLYCDVHAGESLGKAGSADPDAVYTPEAYARAAEEGLDAGFDCFKFDLDVPHADDTDTAARRLSKASIEHKVSLVEAVVDAVGTDADVGVDLHWSFTVETATRLGRRLDDLDLAWIEDPVRTDQTAAHARVADALDTPVLTGENVTRPTHLQALLQAGALDIAAPDVNMCGGLSRLREMAALCDTYSVPLAPHNVSSPVGTVAGAHLAAAVPNCFALEYHAFDVPWWEDVVSRTAGTGPILEDGSVDLPTGPGLGIEVDESVVDEHRCDGETPFRG